MRKTEYISTEFNRYGLGQTGVDRPDTKIGYGMKNRLKDETIDYKDRSSQIAAIERTFEHAKKPIKRHYSRPGVTAVEEIPILPDFDVSFFNQKLNIPNFSCGNFPLHKFYSMPILYLIVKITDKRNWLYQFSGFFKFFEKII